MFRVKDNVVIAEGEAVVVLTRETFEHIAKAYQSTGATCDTTDDMMMWYDVADAINGQLGEQETILEKIKDYE